MACKSLRDDEYGLQEGTLTCAIRTRKDSKGREWQVRFCVNRLEIGERPVRDHEMSSVDLRQWSGLTVSARATDGQFILRCRDSTGREASGKHWESRSRVRDWVREYLAMA